MFRNLFGQYILSTTAFFQLLKVSFLHYLAHMCGMCFLFGLFSSQIGAWLFLFSASARRCRCRMFTVSCYVIFYFWFQNIYRGGGLTSLPLTAIVEVQLHHTARLMQILESSMSPILFARCVCSRKHKDDLFCLIDSRSLRHKH